MTLVETVVRRLGQSRLGPALPALIPPIVGSLGGAMFGAVLLLFSLPALAAPRLRAEFPGLGLRPLATVFLGGGVLSGLVGGLLGPFVRGPAAAGLVGAASLLPLYLLATRALAGPLVEWGGFEWLLAVALSAGTGGLAGARIWHELRKSPAEDEPPPDA